MDFQRLNIRESRLFGIVAQLLCLVVLAGCATAYPPAPMAFDVPNARYTIAPLDTLNISVWQNPELSVPVTVRPDGYVSMPLVDDILAAGKTPSDLSKEMEKALGKFIVDPIVSIVVSGFLGDYSAQVRIVGEVARPLAVPYRQNMSILDIIIQAGGLTTFADGNGAVLIRASEGGKRYSIRLKDLLKRGDISANIAIAPGDVILVPQLLF